MSTRKNRIAVLATLAVLTLSSTGLATLDHQKLFAAKYPDAKALQRCSTCHVKPIPKKEDHDLNAYGKDVATVLSKDKTAIDFAKIESLDSDGDGVSNVDEIKKGTNPGDPKSK